MLIGTPLKAHKTNRCIYVHQSEKYCRCNIPFGRIFYSFKDGWCYDSVLGKNTKFFTWEHAFNEIVELHKIAYQKEMETWMSGLNQSPAKTPDA